MEALQQLVADRDGSPISDLLNEPPQRVESTSFAETLPALPEASGGMVEQLANIFKTAPLPKPAPTTKPTPESSAVSIEPEVYVPLTSEEIKQLAESKAELWADMLNIFFTILNKLMAYQELRKGDQVAVANYEKEIERLGYVPEHYQSEDHPIHAALNRWNNFEVAVQEAEEDAELKPAQITKLQRAFEAELKAKNKRGDLQAGSVTGALISIVASKLVSPFAAFGTMLVNKWMERALK